MGAGGAGGSALRPDRDGCVSLQTVTSPLGDVEPSLGAAQGPEVKDEPDESAPYRRRGRPSNSEQKACLLLR